MQNQNYIMRVPESAENEPRSQNDPLSAIEAIRNLIAALSIAVEATEAVASKDVTFIGDGIDYFAEVDRFESKMIAQALRISHGSQTRAARLLGLNATTLNSKIKSLNINWKSHSDQQSPSTWRERVSYKRQPAQS